MLKVAVVLPYNSFVEVNMCKAFEKAGIDCWFITSDRERLDYRGTGTKFEKYAKTLQLPTVLDNGLLMQYAPFPITPKLVDTVRSLSVDVVNVSEHISPATWLFSIYKKGWKTVLTQHGEVYKKPRDRVYNLLTKRALIPRLDGFVGIALKTKAFLEKIGAQNVKVIPNPIDCDLFKPEIEYEKRENIVLFVGRADTWRKLDLLLRAMKIVKHKMKEALLWIIGAEGNLSPYLRRTHDIKYLGIKAHIEMPKYCNLAKVFVNPPWGAGCGCATSEALSCGTPIVGTKNLDFPFNWRNGECGYLVDENPRSLADAIVEAFLKGNEMSGKCRELALKQFSYESVGGRYLEVFEQVLNTGR